MAKGDPGRTGRRTATSAFGVSRREGHDSSDFYSRFSPPVLSADDRVTPPPLEAANQVLCADARDMRQVPDSSVALVVTSPPYFAGKEYERDLAAGHVPATYLHYLKMLEEVFAECVRKLEPGGRIAVNVANLGRKPYRSLSSDVIGILQDGLGLLLRGEVIWQKALGSAGSCAWGSFQRPSNPVLRDVTERVVVASKGRFSRALSASEREARGLPSVPSISKDEFMEATTDVWQIPSESAGRVGHPAPFPVALPLRLIELYTYEEDVVLDPFLGSGTTAVAALRSRRRFFGYETDPAYVEISRKRLEAERQGDATRPGAGLESGASANEYAGRLLEASGFRRIQAGVTAGNGVEVSFQAEDLRGRNWLFEVAGAYSASGGAGLRRGDILARVVAKAAVLHHGSPGNGLVLLATGLPDESSPGGKALRAVCGRDKPIREALDLADRGTVERLSRLARGT